MIQSPDEIEILRELLQTMEKENRTLKAKLAVADRALVVLTAKIENLERKA